MTTPITVTIVHGLGRAEARRRIDAGFGKLAASLPGGVGAATQGWEGDRLAFRITALAQVAAGVIEVDDAQVQIRIELPGALGLMARALQDRLLRAGQRLLTDT